MMLLKFFLIISGVAMNAVASTPSDAEVRKLLNTHFNTAADQNAAINEIADRFQSKREFVDCLGKFLKDNESSVRKQALCVLMHLKKDATSAVPNITKVLQKDKNPWVRGQAIWTLYAIKGKRSLEHISVALKDKDSNVRSVTLQAIRRVGSPSIDEYVTELQRLLDDNALYLYPISRSLRGARPVKYEAVVTLGEIGEKAQVALPKLRILLREDRDPEIRIVTAVAIAQLDAKDTDAVRYLIKELEDSSSEDTRSDAIQGLAQLKEGRARQSVPILKRLLQEDPSWMVRSSCVNALVKVNGFREDTVDALIKALSDEKPWVQMTSLEALESMGLDASKAIPRVQQVLGEYISITEEGQPFVNGDIRVQAVNTLLSIGKPEVVKPIIEEAAQKSNSEKLRKIFLGKIKEANTFPE